MTGLLFLMNGLLIAGTTGLALWLWSRGGVTLGSIVLVTSPVLRITQMAGWVLNLVTSIFENIGVVQEGMGAISRPHAVIDKPDANALAVSKGDICFDSIGFNYGSAKGTTGDVRAWVDQVVSFAIR